MVVNIEVDRYPGRMKRATDPDVLLLQAAADPTRLSVWGAPDGESSTAMTRPSASGPVNTTGGNRTLRPIR